MWAQRHLMNWRRAARHSLLSLAWCDVKGRSRDANAFGENIHPHLKLSLNQRNAHVTQDGKVMVDVNMHCTDTVCVRLQPERGWAGRCCKGSLSPHVPGQVVAFWARADRVVLGLDPSAGELPCCPLDVKRVRCSLGSSSLVLHFSFTVF